MWPLALLALAAAATLAWYATREHNRYKMDVLALVSASAGLMLTVDSIYRYLEEGVFIELSAEALKLSFLLCLTAIAIWAGVLALRVKPR